MEYPNQTQPTNSEVSYPASQTEAMVGMASFVLAISADRQPIGHAPEPPMLPPTNSESS